MKTKLRPRSYHVIYKDRRERIQEADILPAFWGDPETQPQRLKLALELHLRNASPGSTLITWEVNR